jgi:zinc transport system substrate-binding protein
LAAVLIGALGFDAAAAAPEVVVSIKPLHSLAARIMAGVGEPTLLVGGNASLHTYSLKPSQAAALEAADLVVWVGPGFESFLVEPLEALAGEARVLAATDVPGMLLLPPREGGSWEAHEDEHEGEAHEDEEAVEHEDEEHAHEAGEVDGHVFLDPANAMTMAAALTAALEELDPANAAAYAANGQSLQGELAALDQEIAATLAAVRDQHFVVFHDAYQYFEARYGLAAIGSITVSPEQQPGARRLTEIRDKIAALHAVCIFAEPGFEPALIETLVAGTDARSGILDPEGAALPAGPELYSALLRALAKSLRDCLAPQD